MAVAFEKRLIDSCYCSSEPANLSSRPCSKNKFAGESRTIRKLNRNGHNFLKMPEFLMYHIDTDCVFQKAEYIFEFEGRRYRLIRGTDKEFDKLCTITDGSSKENEESHERTMRFLDYLAWEFGQPIRYIGASGHGFSEGRITLETAIVNSFHGRILRSLVVVLACIPDVINDTQRLALSLWNEANYSNSHFLGFINFWKIFELTPHGKKMRGKAHRRAIEWINNVPPQRVYMGKEMEDILAVEGVDLGTYLYDRCRNAIAHVTIQPVLYCGRIADWNKIYRVYRLAKKLAEFYIREELGLKGYPAKLKILNTKKRSSALKLMRQLRRHTR